MRYLLFGLLAALICTTFSAKNTPTMQDFRDFKSSIQDTLTDLSRQLMLQQLFVEERIRSDGDSGLKQIRIFKGGVMEYQQATFTSESAGSIHEHSNYDRTVGIGELIVVLNGVEFRTRHNDYKLVMPSRTNKKWNSVEDIAFPPVPPSVLSKKTVQEQIDEMRMYFKAFHEQNPKIRNYKPYFKPVLTYLEGFWMTDAIRIHEAFQSDRHFLDARSWVDLQDKIRYQASTGGKNEDENFAFLPRTIVNITEDGKPIFAQWNYRIVCHPIKIPIHLKDLELIDDLGARMLLRKNMTQFGLSRSARYRFASYHDSKYSTYLKDIGSGKIRHNRYDFGLLDRIMMEIPGKDNYNGYLNDRSFGVKKYRLDFSNSFEVNTARYHRWYKMKETGAMGTHRRHRGFSDNNMFVAQTTNSNVTKLEFTECEKENCTTYSMRTSYAIPMELIWLTPLSNWNPYNLTVYNKESIITADGRDGGFDEAKAFNGTTFDNYYRTPREFYSDEPFETDPADTATETVGVLDNSGQVRRVSAAGTRILFPEIPGVGKVRQRYPVFPVHQEGSATWKNLHALQDMVMRMESFSSLYEVPPSIQDQ